MFCFHCGNKISEETKFCGACGKPQPSFKEILSKSQSHSEFIKNINNINNLSHAQVANYIYILYFLGYITGGMTTLLGAVWAYTRKKQATDYTHSHFTFQVATFMRSLIISVALAGLFIIQIVLQSLAGVFSILAAFFGFLLLGTALLAFIYIGIRTYKGLAIFSTGHSISNPHCLWLPEAGDANSLYEINFD